jgi:NitT/TauT family transport system permease protein
MTGRAARIAAPVLFGIAVLVLWQVVVTAAGVPAFLLPAPSAIATQIDAQFPVLLATAAITGGNALVGLVAGFLAGVVLAVLAARSRLVQELVTPVVLAASAVPIVALAPVFTTMFGSTTEIPRRLVVTVVVIVPVFVSTLRGLRQVQPVHAELMAALAATPWQQARFVRLPGAVPYVMTGLRLAAPRGGSRRDRRGVLRRPAERARQPDLLRGRQHRLRPRVGLRRRLDRPGAAVLPGRPARRAPGHPHSPLKPTPGGPRCPDSQGPDPSRPDGPGGWPRWPRRSPSRPRHAPPPRPGTAAPAPRRRRVP